MANLAYWAFAARAVQSRGRSGGSIEWGQGRVILRVIHGRGGPGQLEAVAGALRGTLAPAPAVGQSLARFHLGHRAIVAEGGAAAGNAAASDATARDGAPDDMDIGLISCWASAEEAAAADRRGTSPLAIARTRLRDLTVEHFEIDETVLREVGRRARLLRIATGQFSKPGSDKEMLDLLRQRVPNIGSPMVEAHIGRRMVGREVRITFISTWFEAPSGRDLRDAFWTDIALRYDSFDVRVYQTIPITGDR